MSKSYRDILRTTGVIGAVQIIRLIFGLVRNKLIAMYFGSAGLGIWSLYLSFTEMVQSAASLGLEKSSVKQIAENHENLHKRNLAIQVTIYCLTVFSLFITLVIAYFSSFFSQHIFGDIGYEFGILICCGVIFFNSITAAFKSILNGLAEIKSLAICQLWGILVGNLFVFSLLPFYPVAALPVYFMIISVAGFVSSLIYICRLKLPFKRVFMSEILDTMGSLMKVGLAFWVTAMFMTFVTYMINIFLKNNLGLESLGLYQASWTISNLYIGIILSSMGVAFFPKITKIIENKEQSVTAINEQIEFGLLVSLPFVIGIYIFAPYCLSILYSAEFTEGASIIRWQMLGVIIRLFGFPFGYALMAKGKAVKYTIAQFIFNTLNYVFIVWLVLNVGFDALGINYVLAYIIYVLLMGFFCYREIGYKMSSYIYEIILVYIGFLIMSVLIISYLNVFPYIILGTFFVVVSSVYSLRKLTIRLNIDVARYIKGKLSI